jgi:hypothetical protein
MVTKYFLNSMATKIFFLNSLATKNYSFNSMTTKIFFKFPDNKNILLNSTKNHSFNLGPKIQNVKSTNRLSFLTSFPFFFLYSLMK